MPTTLLTGGNGFVGSSILAQLLSQSPPHNVICTVRNPASGQDLLSAHPDWDTSLISFTTVSDFTKECAFDAVFKDHPEIDYIIHCAAPLVNDPRATDFVEHFEKPNVAGNIGLLTSARKHGSNVKAIAVTGTINSITTGAQDDVKARAFTSDAWLPYTRDDAIKMNNNYINYCVGKKVGEEVLWKFMKDEKPKFQVSVFLPTLIFGPMQQKVDSIEKLNFSMGQVYGILNSGKSETGTVPNTAFPGYVSFPPSLPAIFASLSALPCSLFHLLTLPDRRPRPRQPAHILSDQSQSSQQALPRRPPVYIRPVRKCHAQEPRLQGSSRQEQ